MINTVLVKENVWSCMKERNKAMLGLTPVLPVGSVVWIVPCFHLAPPPSLPLGMAWIALVASCLEYVPCLAKCVCKEDELICSRLYDMLRTRLGPRNKFIEFALRKLEVGRITSNRNGTNNDADQGECEK